MRHRRGPCGADRHNIPNPGRRSREGIWSMCGGLLRCVPTAHQNYEDDAHGDAEPPRTARKKMAAHDSPKGKIWLSLFWLLTTKRRRKEYTRRHSNIQVSSVECYGGYPKVLDGVWKVVIALSLLLWWAARSGCECPTDRPRPLRLQATVYHLCSGADSARSTQTSVPPPTALGGAQIHWAAGSPPNGPFVLERPKHREDGACDNLQYPAEMVVHPIWQFPCVRLIRPDMLDGRERFLLWAPPWDLYFPRHIVGYGPKRERRRRNIRIMQADRITDLRAGDDGCCGPA